jgi:predicted site-specific integrase-resolvase
MNLAVWAERNAAARVTAYRWFHAGLLPVPAQRVGRLILVNDAAAEMARHGRAAVYARVSSADQKADLDRQVARVTGWATAEQIPVDKVVSEVGSALNGHRRKFLRCCATRRWAGSWWSTGIGSAGSALNTSKPHLLPRAASWLWSTQPRSTMTWCAI